MNVFLTGHTGFKGAWMLLYLKTLGYKVHGFSLAPAKNSLFELGCFERLCDSHTLGDVRNKKLLTDCMMTVEPDIVIHFAAQSLVLESYRRPVDTFETNINGTLHTLFAASELDSVTKLLIITTDKVYRNDGRSIGYNESDILGGSDPYSKSKAIADEFTQYWSSMYPEKDIAIARAGNVIGGGDASPERIMPDLVRDFFAGNQIILRNPNAIRPWQYVLDCLSGYIALIESPRIQGVQNIWNFGPNQHEYFSVADLYNETAKHFQNITSFAKSDSNKNLEASALSIDSSKARKLLGWENKFNLKESVNETLKWYRRIASGDDVLKTSKNALEYFLELSH